MTDGVDSPVNVRRVLEQIGLKPGKSMGQNFLVDGNILRIIIAQSDLSAADRVLEVGPGLGVVTGALLNEVAGVVAIEKDRKLHSFLSEQYAECGRLELLRADALDVDLGALFSAGVNKMVSNLPYSVASRILVDVFNAADRPERIVVTLQQDVAERICAVVGEREYGLLSVLAQRYYQVRIVKEIGPNCFIPRPRVASALLVCRRRDDSLPEAGDDFFMRVVKMTFTHRRKVMKNALRGAGFKSPQIEDSLLRAEIDPDLRPAQLSPNDWVRLSQSLSAG